MSKIDNLKIAVIGATGYTGLDLIYYLSKHPKVKILNLCAKKNLGKKISFFDKRIKIKSKPVYPVAPTTATLILLCIDIMNYTILFNNS